MTDKTLKKLLDDSYEKFNTASFIEDDPISLPHRFNKLQDIEIIGFWVAMLAWGQRKQIIKSGERLIELMDNSPHDFILNHKETDRKTFLKFWSIHVSNCSIYYHMNACLLSTVLFIIKKPDYSGFFNV